jgi:transmembrane sensor
VLSVPAAELAERLAWRVPRLEFSQTPLAEALELFNRHSRVRLVLGDADLGNLHLSGIVRADNTAALLQLLKSDFGLRSEPRGENEIVLPPGAR